MKLGIEGSTHARVCVCQRGCLTVMVMKEKILPEKHQVGTLSPSIPKEQDA